MPVTSTLRSPHKSHESGIGKKEILQTMSWTWRTPRALHTMLHHTRMGDLRHGALLPPESDNSGRQHTLEHPHVE